MTAEQSESVNARKTRWHQSTLSTLLDGCSWQYFLTYVLEMDQGPKPFAAVGTAFHSAVELHERNRMNDEKTSKKEMLDEGTTKLTAAITDPELLVQLLPNLEASINNWYDKGQREWLLAYTPIAIEPEFTLPLVDNARPIGGYIDAIYCDDTTGTLFVVDHKTAKDFSRWRDGEGHRHQAAMYSAALVLSEDFPMITEMPEMVYMVTRTSSSTRANFEHTRIIRVQPTIEDVVLLGDRIRSAEKIVATESYKPNTGWPLCSAKWCPFYEGCQVTGELLGTPKEIRDRVRPDQKLALSEMMVWESTQYTSSATTITEEVNNV